MQRMRMRRYLAVRVALSRLERLLVGGGARARVGGLAPRPLELLRELLDALLVLRALDRMLLEVLLERHRRPPVRLMPRPQRGVGRVER